MNTGICQQCGAVLPAEDPLGGGICEGCLWGELSGETGEGGNPLQHLVEGHDILGELGRGGMGVVYRARQHRPPRDVALKMLLPLDAGKEELRLRFQQEAKTLAELEHPAILPLYEVGEADGLPYFTMKLVSGGTLAHRLQVEGKWPARRAAELMALISDGLQYAHAHGVIHRDIKPGNVLFDSAGRVYLADFGLAKLEDGQITFTRSAGVMGTPGYLAPEIASLGARAATISSDVYSMGAVLYELIAGRPPFVSEALPALFRKIVEDEPEAPSTLNSQIPRDLEIICLKCLRKTPQDRYASAADFASDLRRWMAGEPILARHITTSQRLWKWAVRRPALASLGAALVVLSAASGLWLAATNRELNESLARTEEAQARADQRAEFMLGSFGDSLEGIGRLDMLIDAFRNLHSTDTGSDEASLRRRVDLLTRWGRALRYQGQSREALSRLEDAVRTAGRLPPSALHRLFEVRARVETAMTRAEIATSIGPARELEELVRKLAAEAPEGGGNQDLLEARALVLAALGSLGGEYDRGNPAVGMILSECSGLRRQLLQLDPDNPSRQFALASVLREEATALSSAAEKLTQAHQPDCEELLTAASERITECLALVESLCARPNPHADWRRVKANALREKGQIMLMQNPDAADEALTEMMKSVTLLEEMSAADQMDWRTRLGAAGAHFSLAGMLQRLGNQEERGRQLVRHAELAEDLFRRVPGIRQVGLARVNACIGLAKWKLDAGMPAEVESFVLMAFEAGQNIVRQRVAQASDMQGFAGLTQELSGLRAAAGNAAAAEQIYHDALGFMGSLPATGEAGDWCRWTEASLQRRLADLYRDSGRLSQALEMNLAALDARADLLRRRTEPAVSDPHAVPHSYTVSGAMKIGMGNADGALELAEEALDLRWQCVRWAGHADRWGEAVAVACEAAVAQTGSLAARARNLAERAIDELYRTQDGEAVLAASPPDRKSGNSAIRQRLTAIAYPDRTPPPADTQQ